MPFTSVQTSTTHSHVFQLLASLGSLGSPDGLFSFLPGAFAELYSWLARCFCLLPDSLYATLCLRPSPATNLSITLEGNCFGPLTPGQVCWLCPFRQPVNSMELFLAHAVIITWFWMNWSMNINFSERGLFLIFVSIILPLAQADGGLPITSLNKQINEGLWIVTLDCWLY